MRRVEPYYLIFRWSSWYMWGWCKSRQDFRLFKLNRMDKLRMSEDVYEKRQVPLPNLENEQIFPDGIRVKAVLEAGCKWRLVEEFGADCFEELPNGKLLFHADYSDRESLITWLLTFRDQAVLLEPRDVRQEISALLQRMKNHYLKEETDGIH